MELISTAIFGGNPTITSIDIGNNSNLFNSINADIGNVFVEAVGNQTSLTSINLSSTDLSSTVAHTLAPALSGKPIKYLNLSNNIMQFEVVNFLKAIAPQFLVHLDLSSIEPYNIFPFKALTPIFSSHSVIERLELRGNSFRLPHNGLIEPEFVDFTSSIAQSKTLQYIGLAETHFPFFRFVQIVQSLKDYQNKVLCSIDLHSNKNLWKDLVLRTPTSQELSSYNELGIMQATHDLTSPRFLQLKATLLQGLIWQSQSLINLNLSDTFFTGFYSYGETICNILSEGLQGARIKTLDLSNNSLSLNSLRALTKVFKTIRLEELDLSGSCEKETVQGFLRLALAINSEARLILNENESLLLRKEYTSAPSPITMEPELMAILGKMLPIQDLNEYCSNSFKKVIISGFPKPAAELSVPSVGEKTQEASWTTVTTLTKQEEPESLTPALHEKMKENPSSSAPIPSLFASDSSLMETHTGNEEQLKLAGETGESVTTS